MRISVSPPGTGTIAIRCISAVQRQSGSSVESASSRRSNFDMTPPIPVGKCMCIGHRSPSEFFGDQQWGDATGESAAKLLGKDAARRIASKYRQAAEEGVNFAPLYMRALNLRGTADRRPYLKRQAPSGSGAVGRCSTRPAPNVS